MRREHVRTVYDDGENSQRESPGTTGLTAWREQHSPLEDFYGDEDSADSVCRDHEGVDQCSTRLSFYMRGRNAHRPEWMPPHKRLHVGGYLAIHAIRSSTDSPFPARPEE